MISREKWPFLVLVASHWLSLLGTVLVTTAGILWLLVLAHEVRGSSSNPYIGIALFVVLPILFFSGLLLIPLGMLFARRRVRQDFLAVDSRQAAFRRLAMFLIPTTLLNLVIGAHLTYEAVEYMETESFCGQSCHVMKPQFTAYRDSPHSRVGCVECHVAPGALGWLEAKTAGTRQLIEVAFNTYPRPIPSAVETDRLVPATETCEKCHWPDKFSGSKLRVISNFAEDEANTVTRTVLMMKIGGNGAGGIHGAHFGPGISLRYAASDGKRQSIPWIEYRDTNRGISRVYTAAERSGNDSGKLAQYDMQCIDCHNRPTHTFELPERAVQRAMASGELPVTLPFLKKKSVEVLKASYSSSEDAASRIPEAIKSYYRSSFAEIARSRTTDVEKAAGALLTIYSRNVFPELKVTWGTYPNNLGHTDFPGCFRCHDGAHTSADQNSITQDCAACHEMLAVDEPAPEILKTLGLADPMNLAPRK
jgi:nitrate/TMAO reductase-like tetraheme cytochrome c subunit